MCVCVCVVYIRVYIYIYICVCVTCNMYMIYLDPTLVLGVTIPTPKKEATHPGGCLPQDHLHHLARFLRFADLLGRDDTTEVPFGWCYDLVGGIPTPLKI